VMRGRKQALLAALLATGTAYFYWIGAAVIALVTLRKGWQQGAVILAWALLPAMVQILWLGDTMPMASLISITVAAAALRFSVKWEWALLVIAASCYVYAAVLAWFGGDLLTPFIAASNELLQNLRTTVGEQGGTAPDWLAHLKANNVFVGGMFGGLHGMMTMVSLLLARHWQAMLYNPGGFGNEFRALRFAPAQTLLLLGAMVSCILLENSGHVENITTWAAFATLPLLVAGIALVHGVAAIKNWKTSWLFAFHVLWIVSDWVKVLLVLSRRKDTHQD
jgi:hypothetical protein